MTYVVYADVMLVTNSLINLFTIILASAIQGKHISFMRALGWSVLTGILMEFVYLMGLNHNKLLYLILYVAIYMLMTFLYYKWCNWSNFFTCYITVFLVMIILNGIVHIGYDKGLTSGRLATRIIVSLSALVYAVTMLGRRYQNEKSIYDVELSICSKKITLKGFYDSGNHLFDGALGKAIVIIDYQALENIFDEVTFKCILEYHRTGEFDYSMAANDAKVNFHPVIYNTVSSAASLMPVFAIDYIKFLDTGETKNDISAGISRLKFSNLYVSDYQVLLNESLKPNRKEKFK